MELLFKCSRCQGEFPAEDFRWRRDNAQKNLKDVRRTSYCRECCNIAERESYRRQVGSPVDDSLATWGYIGEELGISSKTARTHYLRALKKIRKYLDSHPLERKQLLSYLLPEYPEKIDHTIYNVYIDE